jgi:signal transduction histidine kinase
MAELGVLAASLLHELRQPLFAIKAHAQLARTDAKPERLDRILEQVAHVEGLLRYYSGFGSGAQEPEVLFDLNEPVRQAAEMLGHKAKKAGAVLETELSGTLLVRGREIAARQITINLVQNALDAVEGRHGRVIVRTCDVGQHVRLSVEDDGPGIPEELRARMCDAFVTTKPPGRGTGLGLYIVRHLVEEVRGQLRLVDPPSGGTRFEIDWPRS